MDRLRRLFATHPHPASDAGDEAFALVTAASECAAVCAACADACLQEEDASSLRACIRQNLDCADICAVVGRLIARPGRQDPATLRTQLDACASAHTAQCSILPAARRQDGALRRVRRGVPRVRGSVRADERGHRGRVSRPR